MEIKPIQIMEQGVLIPLEYLHNAHEFEFELVNGHVLVRAKQSDKQKQGWPYEWIGIARSSNPNASMEVEEILMAEVDRRAGFTLDPYPEEEPEEPV